MTSKLQERPPNFWRGHLAQQNICLFSILGLGSRAQWKTGKISKINCASVGAEED
jgi:hypothetical protein